MTGLPGSFGGIWIFSAVLHLQLGQCFFNTAVIFTIFRKSRSKKNGNIFVCLFLLFNRVQAIELNTFFNNTMSMENRITVILIIQ